jgi:hypothetical protein
VTTACAWPKPTWRCNDAGEHDAEARAQALILGLGFKVSELE